MNSRNSVSFEPRRSFRRIWIIMAGFGIFIPLGLVLYFASGESAGLFVAGFGLLPVVYMLFLVVSPGSRYTVGQEGVSLRKGTAQRLIPLEDVHGAAVLSEDQARDILKQYMTPRVESERERNMKEWLTSSKAYGLFTRYCTVPIIQEQTSAGHEVNIVKFGTKAAGRFVILKLTSGEEFLLSPEDSEGFFSKLSSLVPLSDTSPSSSYTHTADPVRRIKLRSFYKYYRWIAFAVTLAVILIIIILNFDLLPNKTGAAAGEPAVETGWINDDTFRFLINARINIAEEDPEIRRKELINTAASGYQLNFISQVIGWYCKEEEIELDDVQYDALHGVLWDLINNRDLEVLSSIYNEEMTELTVEAELTDTDLRQAVTGMLENALGQLK